jgi:Berberine and berberine like
MGPVRSVADLRERHKGPVIAPQDRAFELARGAARVAPEATAFAGREARCLETEFGVERFSHLQAVKRRYDPANAFRFNHNIAPD